MRAIVQNGYGSPEVLELREVGKPAVEDDGVLVRVRAAALHAGDYFALTGEPYLVRLSVGWPRVRDYVPGFDAAGVVEAVGKDVSRFRPGDEVFGTPGHTCAEYVGASESMFVPKPPNVTFEQAAAVPTSGLAALQGLRDVAKVQPGQRVLVNGASGGVGHFAVQIAKAMGAEVTGVCSGRNAEMVRALGADHVIDYTREDFTQNGRVYDLIFDNVGNRSFSDMKRVLAPRGIHLPNTGHAGIGYVIAAFARSVVEPRQARPFLSTPNEKDLAELRELLESGKLRPIISRTYPLAETGEALALIGSGHASGKVVITV